MNLKNIQTAIDVMNRVVIRQGKVNMGTWQEYPPGHKYVETEAEAYTCGTTACFAGWLALSDDWKKAGGDIDYGRPIMYADGKCLSHHFAVAKFLDISDEHAAGLCYIGDGTKKVYGKNAHARTTTAIDVIYALERLSETGTPYRHGAIVTFVLKLLTKLKHR